jgi:lipopolysaccharide biosynthesis glycosyltransferase
MDGDIYCNNDPMIDLASVTMFGGITVHKTADIFGKDLNTIHEHFDITNPQQNRMNNGVVYYNNKKLSDIGFLDTMGKLFDRSVKLDIPRKGDDSLYSLFQFTHPNYDYHFLPREYNYYPTENIIPEDRDKYSKKDSDLADNCVFYHFGAKSPKPWVLGAKTPDNITDYFINKWRQSLMVNLSAKEMKRCFPDITNQLRKSTPLPRLLNL